MHAFVFFMVMRGGCSYYKCFIIYSLPLFSVPPCYNNPCENGGTCTEVNNAANCTCLNDWGGYNCTGGYQ